MIITPTNMLRKTKEASKTKMMVNERLRIKFRAQKSPDTPGSPEGNTEGPGTASSEPVLPS